jgi:hypothetical protein
VKKISISVVLALAASHAYAAPSLQWRNETTSFATLIQSGYTLVTVDHVPSAENPHVSTTVYYLQKDASLASCQETHRITDDKLGATSGQFSCAELVQPYDPTAPASN